MSRTVFLQYLEKSKASGCSLPEAAAIADMVADAIKDKNFRVYAEDEDFVDFEVICTFSVGNDPTFGLFVRNDDAILLKSTPSGVESLFL